MYSKKGTSSCELNLSNGWSSKEEKWWRLTMANVSAFNQVVPDFGKLATTISLSLAWKWFWKEFIGWIKFDGHQKPWKK